MSDKPKHYDPYEDEPLPEGEEAPPPYVHTMAIVRWIILGGLSIFALIMILSAFGLTPSAGSAKQPTQYHCPMHPTYISNQPGDCPICGMTLVPMDSNSSSVKSQTENDPPAADPPNEAASQTPKAKPGQYTCPMHSEIISDIPGKCTLCGMNLVKVEEPSRADTGKNASNMQGMTMPEQSGKAMSGMEGMEMTQQQPADTMKGMGSHPVPGLVPVTIEPERLQLIGIKTGLVQMHTIDNSLRLVGFITPDETKMAGIHVRTSGWVSNLYVDQTGQFVKKNEILMALYSQDLFQAEQDYITAKETVSRTSADTSLSDMSSQLISAAKERLKLLGLSEEEIAKLDKSSASTTNLAIRSPFTGYVLDKSVLSGQYVTPDQTLFTVADLSDVWLIAEVYERDIPLVKKGMAVKIETTAFPGEQFDGTVSFIYPAVSEKTRTLKVRVEISNPDMRLHPGMYGEVQLKETGKEVLAVPSEAVVNAGETQYAFVIHDGIHFEPRLLKIGRTSDNWEEVLSGLSVGEEVVTSANFLIDSESRLKAAVSGMGGAQASGMEGMPGMEGMK